MKPVLDGWTIVIVGGWNPKIFQPEWVGRHLFPDQEVAAEFLLQAGVQRIRFRIGPILLSPMDERLVVGVAETTDEALQLQEDTAKNILTLLGHTPLRAVGANFRYDEDAPDDDLLDLFSLTDSHKLSDIGQLSPEVEVKRTLEIDGGIVRLRMEYADGTVSFNVNFHQQAESADQAMQALDGRVVGFRELSERLLSEVYDLELDDDLAEENDNE